MKERRERNIREREGDCGCPEKKMRKKNSIGLGHVYIYSVLYVIAHISLHIFLSVCNVCEYTSIPAHMLLHPLPTNTCNAVFDPPPTILYIFIPHPPFLECTHSIIYKLKNTAQHTHKHTHSLTDKFATATTGSHDKANVMPFQ